MNIIFQTSDSTYIHSEPDQAIQKKLNGVCTE
jgi:hypothetical protein